MRDQIGLTRTQFVALAAAKEGAMPVRGRGLCGLCIGSAAFAGDGAHREVFVSKFVVPALLPKPVQ
jgi:hypothetical protein